MTRRSGGARKWALILTELAEVQVTVEYESPAWRVRWTDGPTRRQLADRAAALSQYRVAAPLTADQLRFARSTSPLAAAVAWLQHGSPTPAGLPQARAAVEATAQDLPYPQRGCPPTLLAAAQLLSHLAVGDPHLMGTLMAQAFPPLPPTAWQPDTDPGLPGRVSSIRWPGPGGPPAHLLGPTQQPARPSLTPTCSRCGRPLPAPARRGRPAQFCSTTCRVAAHRQQHPTPTNS